MKLPIIYLNEAKERFNTAIKAKRREIQSMEVRLKIKEVVFRESRALFEWDRSDTTLIANNHLKTHESLL